jgi:argininosuccinate lyase
MTIMKGLPMTYNRDLQEDKEPLFDTVDTAKNCLRVLSEMTKEIKFNEDRMMKCAVRGFSTATDVAEYLVIRGVPFRKAHAIVGNIVKHCIEKKRDLCLLTMEEFRRFYVGFEKDIYKSLGADSSINKRNIVGGTSKKMVMKRIEEIENAARSKSE